MTTTPSSSASSKTYPMATSSAGLVVERGSSMSVSFAQPNKRPTRYSPVISAMLKGHTMKNCDDVHYMNTECLATGSDASICRTAAMYMSMCVANGETK